MFAVRSLRFLAVAVAAVFTASHSIAMQAPQTQQVCFTASVPAQQTAWETAVPLPKFDPLLGTLQQIDLAFTSTVNVSVQVESLDSSITVVNVDLAIYLALLRPDFSVLTMIVPAAHNQFLFSPFDGTIDYGGTSGGTWNPTATLSANATSPPPASDLALFTGLAGNPGTIALLVSAQNSTSVSGTGNIAYVSTGQADGSVQVCYTFLPPVSAGMPYCFGDGTSAACPCGNTGAAGNGCASSVNAAGANLSTTGTASVAGDSLVLHGSGMPDSAALYFQGTTQIDNAFGDGKRCAGGAVIRLGVKINSGGASQYPTGSDPLVSVKGAVSAGSVRNYQTWYRNSATFCTPSTFNLTNGTSVTWMP